MGIPHWDELSSVFSLQLKQVSLVNIFLLLVILMCSLFPYDPYSEKKIKFMDRIRIIQLFKYK